MTIRTLDDGTLVVEERLTLLRFGTAIGALALVAVLVFQYRERGLAPRDIAGGVAGFAVLTALAAWFPDRSFRFEPQCQRLSWSEHRLFGTRGGEVPFADVLRVSRREDLDTDSRTRRVECQPLLVTRTRTIPLSSTMSIASGDWDALSAAIARVLGREDVVAPSTPESLAAEGRMIEAVALTRRRAIEAGRPMSLGEAKATVDRLRAAEAAKRAS